MPDLDDKTILNRVAIARHTACLEWPYAATAILSLTPIISRTMTPTAAVDARWRLYVNPDTLSGWDDKKLTFVMKHEVAHLLLRHHVRGKRVLSPSADQSMFMDWNKAADIAIHSLMEADRLTIPADALRAKMFGFREGLSVEEYYGLLRRKRDEDSRKAMLPPPQKSASNDGNKPADPGAGPGVDSGTDTDSSDHQNTDKKPVDLSTSPKVSDDNQHEQPADHGGSCSDGQQREWEYSIDEQPFGKGNSSSQDGTGQSEGDGGDSMPGGLGESDTDQICKDVSEAATNGRGVGSGGLARIADHMKEPTFSPERLLRSILAKKLRQSTSGGGTTSYKRPARRPPIAGEIRAKTYRPNPDICFLLDTSGSMGRDDLNLCTGLVSKCLRSLSFNGGVRVVSGDTKVSVDKKIFRATEVKMIGGGGTDMGRLITEIAEGKNPPDLILCATDGITPWPKKKLKVPVVACITRHTMDSYYKVPDWMKVVYLK